MAQRLRHWGSAPAIRRDAKSASSDARHAVLSADIHRTSHNGALKFSVEVGLLPDLFLDACLQTAHAMGDVHRRADFVGGRR